MAELTSTTIPPTLQVPRLHLLGLPGELRNLVWTFWITSNPVVRHHILSNPFLASIGFAPTAISAPRNATYQAAMARRRTGDVFAVNKQVYRELTALINTATPGSQRLVTHCHAISFVKSFDMFVNPLSGMFQGLNLQHIWICLDETRGRELVQARPGHSYFCKSNYALALLDLQNVLMTLTNLERLEIEWTIPDFPLSPEPIDGATLFGILACNGCRFVGSVDCVHMPRRELREYGYIVGRRHELPTPAGSARRFSDWHIQFFDQPGVYGWIDHRLDGVEPLFTRTGPRLALTQIPIAYGDWC